MRVKKQWTGAELEDLKKNYSMTRNKELAAKCNTSIRSMVRKAQELGLEKDPSFRDSIDFASFRKGTKPWNKGKTLGAPGPNQAATLFKKGRKAPTKDPDILKKAVDSRNETIRKEKLRLRYGMDAKTKLNLKNLD
jgi:hypothetical protein